MRAASTMSLIIWLLLPIAEARCQESYVLNQGDQVRVYGRGVQRNLWDWHGPDVTGTVLAVTSDSVAFLTKTGATVILPVNSIGGVEVNRGPRSNWLIGMTAGAVIGAGAGLITGLIVNFERDGCYSGFPLEPTQRCQDTWVPVLGTMGLGALGGGLIGAAIGSLIKTDRWAEVSLDRHPVRFIAGGGRFGVVASLRF